MCGASATASWRRKLETADVRELRALQQENVRLKKLLAEQENLDRLADALGLSELIEVCR